MAWVSAHSAVTEAPDKPKSEFGALKFRILGPAISGRVDRVAGVPGDPLTYYAAFSQGGVWKSENGGRDWKPVFDGADQLDRLDCGGASDPNVVYVGSGEANIRGNVAFGTGIFKSVDAGKNWQQVWKTHGQIGTMAIDPKNSDIAFAAVLGSPFGPGKERGVYRTLDGGHSWQQVLFVDETHGRLGCGLRSQQPAHPLCRHVAITAPALDADQRRAGERTVPIDRWGRVLAATQGQGTARGDWGKVGVRVAPSNSKMVYALIEAKDGGLFRSEDGGQKWERASSAHVLSQRAWYYSCLTIDPTDPTSCGCRRSNCCARSMRARAGSRSRGRPRRSSRHLDRSARSAPDPGRERWGNFPVGRQRDELGLPCAPHAAVLQHRRR